MTTMIGILVHGDNHFIVSGPSPIPDVALALIRHWSLIQIGVTTPPALEGWHIITRTFRENLEWAVIVGSDTDISPAENHLLDELSARGNHSPRSFWLCVRHRHSSMCRRHFRVRALCKTHYGLGAAGQSAEGSQNTP